MWQQKNIENKEERVGKRVLEGETVFFPHAYRMQDKQRGAGACAEDSKMKTGM